MVRKIIFPFLFLSINALFGQLNIQFTSNFANDTSLKICLDDVNFLVQEYNKNNSFSKEIVCDLILKQEVNQDTIFFQYQEDKLTIIANSQQNLVYGIYYFLQEKLNILFFHPKETKFPKTNEWPLKEAFKENIYPKFSVRGYHVHTTHPIELSEYVLDHKYGNKGVEEVKTYIDWLVRNGQNYFEIVLLESIKLNKWVTYFKEIEEYAHQRGVILGLNVSLHHIQQKIFTLYKNKPNAWRSKKKQIISNIHTLCEIKWDYWVVDFKTHEFSEDNNNNIYKYKKLIFNELEALGVKFADKYHVVNKPDPLQNLTDTSIINFISKTTGLVHTVMFYGLKDNRAPVYEVENFHHSYDKLLNSLKYRETWYYPESAYWVTFDNAVPLMLTPYLNARLEDIQLVDSIKVNGHSTFTSGWEWGYWLIDWSIARWTWQNSKKETPNQFLHEIVENDFLSQKLDSLAELQEKYIKDSNLIQYLDAQSATDELPTWIFNKEFHPRPKYPYKYIRNKATLEEITEIKKDIQTIHDFVALSENIIKNIPTKDMDKLTLELYNGFLITILRAKHRKYILEYLVSKNQKESKEQLHVILNKAKEVRLNALEIVKIQESMYRYPLEIINQKRKNKTAYRYGYLYTVSNLYFWEREELQAKNNKYSAWYKKINSFLRISGVIN